MLITSDLEKLIRSLASGLENFDQKTSNRYKGYVQQAVRAVQIIIDRAKVESQLVRQIYSYGSTGIKVQVYLNKPYMGTYEDTIAALNEALLQCKKIAAVKSDPRNAAAIAANPTILGLLNTPGQLGAAQQLLDRAKK